jgi:hypothetical protein
MAQPFTVLGNDKDLRMPPEQATTCDRATPSVLGFLIAQIAKAYSKDRD